MTEAPFKCQVFVCVNDRQGVRKSCADSGGLEIRAKLKEAMAARSLSKAHVRVSSSLCQGQCDQGPNVMIYPQNKWFSKVTLDQVDEIADTVARLLKE
jgi:(2Fe-2S) ferredoxin